MRTDDLLNASLTGRILDMIRHIEAYLQVTITIHDLRGLSANLDFKAISATVSPHLPFPEADRARSDDYCMRDCRIRCNERAEQEGKPFIFDCWKGAREIVVPILQDGVHVATLFAGVFRGKTTPPPGKLRALRKELPVLEAPEKLSSVLHFLAQGLLREIAEARDAASAEGDRKSMIRRYVWLHAHKPVSLNDLANNLALSPSHASHLVSRLFGISFQQLLLEERIRRAQGLLRTTELPLGMIAERTGFASVFYFSRQFKRLAGIPPGRFRTQNRARNRTGTFEKSRP